MFDAVIAKINLVSQCTVYMCGRDRRFHYFGIQYIGQTALGNVHQPGWITPTWLRSKPHE